ncbi:hypothetical protein [Pseudomonas syringae pv. coryli]|uniref:hypothetical protein n=1 Tax=Pseudomonas syringae pv. coryli TaxID=317659 RepID=UPI0006193D7B|nr:hypothetical protein [Pseudomonas syringae pv. coryli]
MKTTHQEIVLQILTAVMLVNAQGRLLGFFDYSGHVQMVSAHFYAADAFDDLNAPRKVLHSSHAWLDVEHPALGSLSDSGEEKISVGLTGLLEFVQSLLQPTDQLEGEQAA